MLACTAVLAFAGWAASLVGQSLLQTVSCSSRMEAMFQLGWQALVVLSPAPLPQFRLELAQEPVMAARGA